MEATKSPKINQNLDTNFLKLIAVITMLIDHIGKIFFPDNMVLAIIGRIAFPLFAYCLVVGCLYTSDWKKYILRLGIFAIVSQPFFNMAFHPTWAEFIEQFFSLNIFFTLIAGVFVVTALMDIKKRWWLIIIAVAMEIFLGLDYGFYGIVMMVIFYLCRKVSWLSALLITVWTILWARFGDFVTIAGIGFDRQAFSLLALPLIHIHTNVKPKINKYFFYAFYPAHLLILFAFRIFLKV